MENPRRDTTNTQPPTHYPACTRRTKSSTSSPPNSVQVESATKALRPVFPRVTQFILTISMIRMTGCQLTFYVPAVNPNQNIPSVSEQTDDYPRGMTSWRRKKIKTEELQRETLASRVHQQGQGEVGRNLQHRSHLWGGLSQSEASPPLTRPVQVYSDD